MEIIYVKWAFNNSFVNISRNSNNNGNMDDIEIDDNPQAY